MAAFGCIPIMPRCCSIWCNRRGRPGRPSRLRTKEALVVRHCRHARSRWDEEAGSRRPCRRSCVHALRGCHCRRVRSRRGEEAWSHRPCRRSCAHAHHCRRARWRRRGTSSRSCRGSCAHALTGRHYSRATSRRNAPGTRPCPGSYVIGKPATCLSRPRYNAPIGHTQRGVHCCRGNRRRCHRLRRRWCWHRRRCCRHRRPPVARRSMSSRPPARRAQHVQHWRLGHRATLPIVVPSRRLPKHRRQNSRKRCNRRKGRQQVLA